MMRRKLPSNNALLIFESAARFQNFTQAADELALSQSAVCKQIAQLEEALGVALFLRVKKRVSLTSAGRDYASKIRGHLDKLERDTLEVMGYQDGSGILELAVIPTFASQWLIPRLRDFQKQRPDITINLSTKTTAFLFSESLCHAAIHSGKAPWPGTAGDFLMAEDDAIPVCSPELLQRYQYQYQHLPLALQDIASMPLLHLSTRLNDWRHWFELHQYPSDIPAVKGARYELFTMLIEATIAGLGVALIPRYMVAAEIQSGQLVTPNQLDLPEQAAYFLVYPEENANFGPLREFRAWLLEQTVKPLNR